MKKKLLYYIIVLVFIGISSETFAQLSGGKGTLYYRDADGDGYGDPEISVILIPLGGNYVDNDDDCDDTNATIGIGSTWFIDSDGDGFGEMTHFISACTQPTGYVANNTDQCPTKAGTDNGCPAPLELPFDHNYIHTTTYQQPFNIGQESNAIDSDKTEIRKYFDGLGRPKQNIAIRMGGQEEDIITYIEFDDYGRQVKEYLPFADDNNGGIYRGGALGATNDFYNTEKYENTINPYFEKNFEASPLNKILEQAAPGDSWILNKSTDTDHTIKFEYKTNTTTNEVRLYTINLDTNYSPTLNSSGYFSNLTLFKTITKDENWKNIDGYNKTTEEFKDKLGRIVLKRSYNEGEKYDTYYVYDKYGNLSYVLPPKSEPTVGLPNSTKLAELCYQYKYDERNRLVKKKIPGKDWEYIIYDRLDRPILTQDGNQRAKSPDEWLFTKYDVLGRIVYTGIFKSNSSQTSLQTIFNDKKGDASKNYEEKVSSGSGYAGTYYTNTGFPTSNLEVLTVNYYDSYLFNRGGANISVNSYGIASTSNVKGLATGSRIKILGTTNWITTVSYYDYKARPIYIYTKNDYLSTTDIVLSQLDFMGRILETITQHTKDANATITTIDKFTYDHMSRIKRQIQRINNQAEELIVENTYDELGQLVKKGIGHLASSTTNRLQEIDYTYTVRGWLKQVNDVNTLGTKLFSFAIEYDGTTPLYNGNVSKVQWRTANIDNSLKTYNFNYDALNRITSATDNTGHYNLTSVVYDKNGNITSLDREGNLVQNPNPIITSNWGTMDVLKYYYQSNSNKLAKVTDTSSKVYGFKDGTNSGNDYSYDINGNLITDANKGITSISYNHLNLPVEVKFNNSNTKKVNYIYDATGIKMTKVVNDYGSITTTKYANGYVYENNTLQYFPMTEGYIYSDNGIYKYVYQYKDYLDNIRLSYSDIDGNGTISQNEIIEENNYYPFGLRHKGYNQNVSAHGNSVAQKRKFRGNELQEELDLNWYDVSARNYNPATGRWMNLDPLAENMRRFSPYNYTFNNPIVFIDPDGMEPQVAEGIGYALGVFDDNKDDAIKELEEKKLILETRRLNFKQAKSVAQAFINSVFQQALNNGADNYFNNFRRAGLVSDVQLDNRQIDLSLFTKYTNVEEEIIYTGSAYIRLGKNDFITIGLTFKFSTKGDVLNEIIFTQNSYIDSGSSTDGTRGRFIFIKGRGKSDYPGDETNKRNVGFLDIGLSTDKVNSNKFYNLLGTYKALGFYNAIKEMYRMTRDKNHLEYLKNYTKPIIPNYIILIGKPRNLKP